GYVPGTPITLSETYTPGTGGTTGANPATLTFSVDYPTQGLSESVSGAYSNLEGGSTNYTVGLYAQTDGVANSTDFINVNFSSISGSVSVPEPASLAGMMLSAAAMLRRRRPQANPAV
ncbi:MAG TPA: PEP-CTERM sorting domain-containing protein, partial [Tepidisphaeraceae bacterium]